VNIVTQRAKEVDLRTEVGKHPGDHPAATRGAGEGGMRV
jgi:hypothetical protein